MNPLDSPVDHEPASPSTLDAAEVRAQLGEAYDRFGPEDRASHAVLLRSIRSPSDVVLDVKNIEERRFVATICTWDRIGALSVIAGVFQAHGLDVVRADVWTLEAPASPARRRRTPRSRGRSNRRAPRPATSLPTHRLLDVFEVTPRDVDGLLSWDRVRGDISALIGHLARGEDEIAREKVLDLVSAAAPSSPSSDVALLPVSVSVSNDLRPDCTVLTIRSADSPGFLFAFSNALATLNFNIVQAEIRTVQAQAQDRFYLTERDGSNITGARRTQELEVATSLINQFTRLLPRSSNPAQALLQFNALTRQMLSRPDWVDGLRDLESRSVLETIADMMGVSKFLWEDFLRMQHENLFPVLVDVPALSDRPSKDDLTTSLAAELHDEAEHEGRAHRLNRFKDREMFRVDLRHITGRIGFGDFSAELSDLADVVIGAAADVCAEALAARIGIPMLGEEPCPWSVCALGKLGGKELGFGSDVELLFAHKGVGTTIGPQRMENSRYFADFVQSFLASLKSMREGIFEIDLRLRPYGNKGPLSTALPAFREYYSVDGPARQFERLALVKLRPIAGDAELGAQLMELRDAYVYSGRALDVEDIRHLRRRQATELAHSGAVNAKYSDGGLVDVEYYVQSTQIVAGYRDPDVRVQGTLDAIEGLARGGHLGPEWADDLAQAYSFLRRLIDALRAVRGHAKDLSVPTSDSREYDYLARRLHYDAPERLDGEIAECMRIARSVWEHLVPKGR